MSNEEGANYSEVYVWGGDHHGQLGLGEKFVGRSYPDPKIWSFNMVIRFVSCGEEHSAFVSDKGLIYTMGSNSDGRLGIGDRYVKKLASPTLVENLSALNCIMVSCGWGHTVAIIDDGRVYSWGFGEHGALGTGSTESEWSPVRVIVDDKRSVGAKYVSCGSRHTAFISEFGDVYVCGAGDAGQLGTGKRERELTPVHLSLITEKASQVACGIFHTLILTEKGRVFATGGNTFGQLGFGNKKNTNIPIRIKEFDNVIIAKIACGHHSAAISDTGVLYIWGTGVFGEYTSPVKFSGRDVTFQDVDIGGFFGAALDRKGMIWSWGSNTSGELGVNDYQPRISPFPNTMLDNKRVVKFSCGGSYVIAIGRTIRSRKGLDEYSSLNEDGHSRSRISEHFSVDSRHGTTHSQPPYSREEGSRYRSPTRKESSIRHNSPFNERVYLSKNHSSGRHMRSPENKYDSGTNKFQEPDSHQDRFGEEKFLDDLLKQKNLLESSLKIEIEEKRSIQSSLEQLKRKIKDLQDGPGGLAELNNTLNSQQGRIEDLQRLYDQERARNNHLKQEIKADAETIELLRQKEINQTKQIELLHSQIRDLENSLSSKAQEVKELRGALRSRQEETQQIINNKDAELQKRLHEMTEHLSKTQQRNSQLEFQLTAQLNQKAALEAEIADLGNQMRVFTDRLEKAMEALEAEYQNRQRMEEDFTVQKAREIHLMSENKELRMQVDTLEKTLHTNLEAEHESNSRMLQENELLNLTIVNRETQIEELKRQIAALEQNLVENSDKNEKLVSLLSQEIDRQAEDYKQKAMGTIFPSAQSTAQNFKRLSGRSPQTDKLSESYLSQRFGGALGISREEDEDEAEGNSKYGSPEDLKRLLRGEGSIRREQQYYSPHTSSFTKGFSASSDKFGGRKQPEDSGRERAAFPKDIEEQRQRIKSSANRLASILDLAGEKGTIERNFIPSKRVEERKFEGSKGISDRESSVLTFRSTQLSKEPKAEAKADLTLVKERLAALQKNKNALETKMQDFEKKIKTINK